MCDDPSCCILIIQHGVPKQQPPVECHSLTTQQVRTAACRFAMDFRQRQPRLTDSDDVRNLLMARVQHKKPGQSPVEQSVVAMMTEIEMSS